MPLHGFQFFYPSFDRRYDVVIKSLMSANCFVNHIFYQLIVDFERFRHLFERIIQIL